MIINYKTKRFLFVTDPFNLIQDLSPLLWYFAGSGVFET